MNKPFIQITQLVKEYRKRPVLLQPSKAPSSLAVSHVDLTLYEGEVFGLVGESGCGKSTLGKCILQLVKPTSGSVLFSGEELTTLSEEALRNKRKHMQYIFQDAKSCLNPNKTVGWLLEEPLICYGEKNKTIRKQKVLNMLEAASLSPRYLVRYPHELSGGQAQRVAILSALILQPQFVVADEPVSSLDISIQAQILNFFNQWKETLQLTMLFITHDLSVCHYMSDRIGVMYAGQLVEIGTADDVYQKPLHPYTKLLFAAVVKTTHFSKSFDIDCSTDINQNGTLYKQGCPFFARCNQHMEKCQATCPPMFFIESKRQVRCFLYENQKMEAN